MYFDLSLFEYILINFQITVYRYFHDNIQPLTLKENVIELAHVEDIHLDLFYLTVNKQITDNTQYIFL